MRASVSRLAGVLVAIVVVVVVVVHLTSSISAKALCKRAAAHTHTKPG